MRAWLASVILLLALGIAQPLISQERATLVADSVALTGTSVIVAQGHVEVFFQGRGVTASLIRFDGASNRLQIAGPIVLTDDTGTFIIADQADLAADLTNGILTSARVVLNQQMQIAAAQVQLPLHTVELKPLANYPFTPGITAIRGSLYEMKVPLGTTPVPIPGAAIRLAWLHEDNVTWIPSPATAVTNTQGEFTLILRLAPVDVTALDAQGKMSIRLFAKRAAGGEKKHEFQLPHGRVADAVYAWDELL